MFRDLKEYQEIAKIYTEKVSKPEDLDENRNTRGSELAAKRLANKPAPEQKSRPMREPGATSVRQSGVNDSRRLKQRQAEKQAAADKKEVEFRLKNTESSEQSAKADAAPEPRKLTGRERAQQMAKDRIKSGKTIADVKAENQASMKLSLIHI